MLIARIYLYFLAFSLYVYVHYHIEEGELVINSTSLLGTQQRPSSSLRTLSDIIQEGGWVTHLLLVTQQA